METTEQRIKKLEYFAEFIAELLRVFPNGQGVNWESVRRQARELMPEKEEENHGTD